MEQKALVPIILIGAVLLFFTGRTVKRVIDYRKEFKNALSLLRSKFNLTDREARRLEQQYRLETAHFKSGQFKGTFSPGMERFGESYPYGWNSLYKYFWRQYPEHRPYGFHAYIEGGTGKRKEFLKFNSLLDAMATTLHNARMRDGKFEAWYSLDPDAQKRYLAALEKIRTPLADEVYATT